MGVRMEASWSPGWWPGLWPGCRTEARMVVRMEAMMEERGKRIADMEDYLDSPLMLDFFRDTPIRDDFQKLDPDILRISKFKTCFPPPTTLACPSGLPDGRFAGKSVDRSFLTLIPLVTLVLFTTFLAKIH